MTPNETRVLRALAQHLHNQAAALYDPTGSYPLNPARPVTVLGILPDMPDLAVSLNVYNRDPDIDTHQFNPLLFVQLRWRAPTYTAVCDVADQGFDALHSETPPLWADAIRPLWCVRDVSAQPETDNNSRWTKADSYQIRLTP